MSRFFSRKYAALTPYTPGEQPQDMKYIKLNTNESPFPPSPMAQRLARQAAGDLNLYSDPACRDLVALAAEQFAKLPGIGIKTAQRLAYYMLNLPAEDVEEFASSLVKARRGVQLCSCCQNFTDRDV